MKKLAMIVIAAVATGLVVGGVIACGSGNSSSNDQVKAPELKPPKGSSSLRTDEGATGATGTTGQSAPQSSTGGAQTPTTPAQTGGAANPGTGTQSGGANAPNDTQQNDTPPPKNSPAQRFEQFCSQNPGAC